MLCLCKTLGQNRLAARLLLVHGGALEWPPSCRYGSMFWFSRKKFVGSYARFSSAKRSYWRSP